MQNAQPTNNLVAQFAQIVTKAVADCKGELLIRQNKLQSRIDKYEKQTGKKFETLKLNQKSINEKMTKRQQDFEQRLLKKQNEDSARVEEEMKKLEKMIKDERAGFQQALNSQRTRIGRQADKRTPLEHIDKAGLSPAAGGGAGQTSLSLI